MLREIRNVRQVPGELRRRWFTSDTMDLIVWVDDDNDPAQLQLCYDKGHRRLERALTWKRGAGYTHTAVDDGEIGAGHYKSTPILVTDGGFDSERVAQLLARDGAHLSADIIDFVTARINEYGIPTTHLPSLTAATISPHN